MPTWKQQGPLSAALCLEILAEYLVLRWGGLRMLYPCLKNLLGGFILKIMLHWILNSRARSRVVGPSMWPRASEVLLVLNKTADTWGPHQTVEPEALQGWGRGGGRGRKSQHSWQVPLWLLCMSKFENHSVNRVQNIKKLTKQIKQHHFTENN